MLCGRLRNASLWRRIHQEMSVVDALCGLEAPMDCRADWQRAVDQLQEPDLEAEEDPASTAGLLRKRPDGVAFDWGSNLKTIFRLILEYTRVHDCRATWDTDMRRFRTKGYVPLRDKLTSCLPAGWTVDILPPSLSLGMCGSFDEQTWRAALERFNLTSMKATELMTDAHTLRLPNGCTLMGLAASEAETLTRNLKVALASRRPMVWKYSKNTAWSSTAVWAPAGFASCCLLLYRPTRKHSRSLARACAQTCWHSGRRRRGSRSLGPPCTCGLGQSATWPAAGVGAR